MTEVTKAMKAYLKLARDLDGVLAMNWVQRKMQLRMRDLGLIEKNELGYYVPTPSGLSAIQTKSPT